MDILFTIMQIDTSAAVSNFSFRRRGDEWIVAGDGGRAGRVARIRRRNGETASVILTVPAEDGWYFVNAGEVVGDIESRNQDDTALFGVRSATANLSVSLVGETGHELEFDRRRGDRLWTITAVSAKPQHPGNDYSPWSHIVAAAAPTSAEAAQYRAAAEAARRQEEHRAEEVTSAIGAWAALDDGGDGEMLNVWSLTGEAKRLVENPYGVWADFGDDTIRLIHTVPDEDRAIVHHLSSTPERVAAVELLAKMDPKIVEDAENEYHRHPRS